jgi:quercetin dioxygenase-like cupin family protein
MEIKDIPFSTTDWDLIPKIKHEGEKGFAYWQTINFGDIRIRKVEYSAGYLANHWCDKGHILLVLEGELITQLQDGRIYTLSPGMTYQIATNAEPHKSSTKIETKLFIVD